MTTLSQPSSLEGEMPQAQAAALQQLRSSANWFYWIAALSLLNSLIMLVGSEWSFLVGLAVTQILDSIAHIVADGLSSTGSLLVKGIALVLDIGVVGLFVLMGWLSKKRFVWSLIVGMVFYALDGVIFALMGSWLSAGFHVFVLVMLYKGLQALSTLRKLSQTGVATGV